MIIDIPQEQRCSDEEVLQYTHRFQNCLQVSDYIFSKARQPSGHIQLQDVENLRPFINTALRLCQELGLKIFPKAHAIKDHLCGQLLQLKGIGDLSEDFVEQSHQDGIKKEARSRKVCNCDEAAILHCKWEHKKSAAVIDKAKEATGKSVRKKRVSNQDGTTEVVPISKKR